jgi:uncharacterized damage-inducible protein DinB
MFAPQARSPADFQSLFRYTHWANERICSTLQAADDVPERAVDLFSHLLRTQDVWFGRVQGTDHANLDFWTSDDLSTCADRLAASSERWHAALDEWGADELDQSMNYTNSKGTPFETPLRDLLSHVVNHGTHHRAQIALLLREADIAPPATDYIFFVREE